MTPDVNALLAASRSDHPHHSVARARLEEALADAETRAALTLQAEHLVSFDRDFKKRLSRARVTLLNT